MKKLLLLLTFSLLTIFVNAQKDTTVKQPTDSTALLSIKDAEAILKYMEDKLLARDYLLIQGVISQMINRRYQEWIIKHNKNP